LSSRECNPMMTRLSTFKPICVLRNVLLLRQHDYKTAFVTRSHSSCPAVNPPEPLQNRREFIHQSHYSLNSTRTHQLTQDSRRTLRPRSIVFLQENRNSRHPSHNRSHSPVSHTSCFIKLTLLPRSCNSTRRYPKATHA
jgi:hypothetical protein